MFLGVSGSVPLVNMNEHQRQTFSGLLRKVRQTRFGDNKRAAYYEAGVNSATWSRLEGGLSVKPTTLATVALNLWPETDGDWTKVPGMDVGGVPHDAESGYVSGPGDKVEGGADEGDVLRAIKEMRQDMQAMEQRLSERLERLEERGA